MTIPIIYSDKVQALCGELITVELGIPANGVWTFENADFYDIANADGDPLTSEELINSTLTFKCLREMDPLIIQYIRSTSENTVVNGSDWISSFGGIGDNWVGSVAQINEIYNSWNFDGDSQRVTQTGNTGATITQDNVAEPDTLYLLGVSYRATSNVKAVVGGEELDLTRTERKAFPIFPIAHTSGDLHVRVDGGSGIDWILNDGTFSSDDSIDVTLSAGTSYLIVDNFEDVDISFEDSASAYVGDLSDIPYRTRKLVLENTSVSGDISSIAHITKEVHITNSGIIGDIEILSDVWSKIHLDGCSNISGDISNLTSTNTIRLSGTSVSGEVIPESSCTFWDLNDTNLTRIELENSISNILSAAEGHNLINGTFECYSNMPAVTSVSACDAISTLTGDYEWNVLVNHSC